MILPCEAMDHLRVIGSAHGRFFELFMFKVGNFIVYIRAYARADVSESATSF